MVAYSEVDTLQLLLGSVRVDRPGAVVLARERWYAWLWDGYSIASAAQFGRIQSGQGAVHTPCVADAAKTISAKALSARAGLLCGHARHGPCRFLHLAPHWQTPDRCRPRESDPLAACAHPPTRSIFLVAVRRWFDSAADASADLLD